MTKPSVALMIAGILLPAPCSLLPAQAHDHAGSGEQLGRVAFPVSCNAEAQGRFERAMSLLHSFWWEQGETAFRSVITADSKCAMGYWGLALNAWGNPVAGGPGGMAGRGEGLRRGAVAIQSGAALGAPTVRERGFLAAASALYRGFDSIPNGRRLQAYSDTLARLYRDQPGDTEVAIYYALSLIVTAPRTDTTFVRQKRAAEILNPLFRRFPSHPGLAHYIIHANDSPQLALLGLDAARRYAQIAPSAPHAQHMPSHIFIRRGLWEETIEANQRSFDAGYNYAREHNTGVAPEQFHALDYMVYAYLQEGKDGEARRTIARAQELQAVLTHDALVANYNRVAMEARLPLERSDWSEASRLPIRGTQAGIGKALAHFTRGIGAARIDDTTAARAEEQALATIESDLLKRGDSDWARVAGIKRQLVASWIAFAAGDTATALQTVKAAADLEDVTEKHPVTPGELLPARELEGDMLLAARRYADARAAYEATLRREPNRARSLYGSARAAELAGDKAAAKERYLQYLAQMQSGDGDRVDMARAREAVR